MENFFIVLFKNKIKKRIIKKYITLINAKTAFTKLINKSENVIFPKMFESGFPCEFEIGLIGKNFNQVEQIYKKDDFGRNTKVKLENKDMEFISVSTYKIEEKIFDIQKNKKIETKELIKTYLNNDGIKMVSTLHNKVIIQRDEYVWMFSTKNDDEADRFVDCLQSFFFTQKKMDCIFVKDFSSSHRKYLFELLENKGYDKKMLYRKFTTYPRLK